MSTESSSKPSFWRLPDDNFVESLRDPVQRQHLSKRLRKELWSITGVLFFSLAVQAFLVLQDRSEMNAFWFVLVLVTCPLAINDIRHRRHFIELFEVLDTKERDSNPI
jgi:hypothetical protein